MTGPYFSEEDVMSTAVEPFHVSEKERIGAKIVSRLAEYFEEGSRRDLQETTILRAEVPVTGLHALPWLCGQSFPSRGYWSDRENAFELAGVGGTDVITGDSDFDYHGLMGALHERIASARGNPRYFGGLRFSNSGRIEHPWEYFKAYRFILPRFEVFTSNGTTTFACNMLAGEPLKTVEDDFAGLVFGVTPRIELPRPVGRRDNPDRKSWRDNVTEALNSLRKREYEKIVLARKVTFSFPEAVNPACLLSILKEKTARCFHFLFQPDSRAAFVGASPESLYRRNGRTLTTEAIAGSRPRGDSRGADSVLCSELKGNEKELREHAYVVEGIENSLDGMCGLLVGGNHPDVVKLSRCQHLITRFKGNLADGVTDADLLVSLHPTPAVGGFPTGPALQDIARLESFDRGWYAGPVGWISKYGAQFAVGIRSGLCEGRRLHLFSGAGIVDGSVPDQEWEEVENKISDFVNLLGRQETGM